MSKGNKMTNVVTARIQSATAKSNNGIIVKNSFAARAQTAAAVNSNNAKNAVSKKS